MSLEFRNLLLERKIFVSPVPMAAALRVGRSSSSGRSTRSAGGAGVRRRLKAAGVGGPTKTQLKRQQTLAKRRAKLQARGGAAAKPKRAKYDEFSMRPRTLSSDLSELAAHWHRLERRAQTAQAVLAQWEASKRPPKGFRRRR